MLESLMPPCSCPRAHAPGRPRPRGHAPAAVCMHDVMCTHHGVDTVTGGLREVDAGPRDDARETLCPRSGGRALAPPAATRSRRVIRAAGGPLKKLALVPRFDPLRTPARTPCAPPSPSPAPRPPPPELSLSFTTQVKAHALQNKDAIMIEGCPCPPPGIQFGKHKATTTVQKRERKRREGRRRKQKKKSKQKQKRAYSTTDSLVVPHRSAEVAEPA